METHGHLRPNTFFFFFFPASLLGRDPVKYRDNPVNIHGGCRVVSERPSLWLRLSVTVLILDTSPSLSIQGSLDRPLFSHPYIEPEKRRSAACWTSHRATPSGDSEQWLGIHKLVNFNDKLKTNKMNVVQTESLWQRANRSINW